MDADYDGRQVVGIDLHRRRSVIVRMTEAGERLAAVRIDNDPMTLAAAIAEAGENPDVVLEATYGWYWAVDVLQAAGATVHLAHPLGVKGFTYRRVKNDVREAADLADLLRMGLLAQRPEGQRACGTGQAGPAHQGVGSVRPRRSGTPRDHAAGRAVPGPHRRLLPAGRWAAVEAAQKIPASAGWLTSTRARIADRRGRNIATVAVARKLLTLVYYGLRDGHIRALHPAKVAA